MTRERLMQQIRERGAAYVATKGCPGAWSVEFELGGKRHRHAFVGTVDVPDLSVLIGGAEL